MRNLTQDDVQSVTQITGGGINGNATFVVTAKNGDKFVYKIVGNEQKSEQLANIIDNVLDLGTQADAVINSNISLEFLQEQGLNIRNLDRAIAQGGGHLQGWCQPDCQEWNNVGKESGVSMERARSMNRRKQKELIQNENFREQFHRNTLLDFIGGNWDRHGANFMVTGEGNFVGIDNGFHGGLAGLGGRKPIDGTGTLFANENRGAANRTPMTGRWEGTRDEFIDEAGAVFDRYFDMDKIKDIQDTLGMANRYEGRSDDYIRKQFIEVARTIWGV